MLNFCYGCSYEECRRITCPKDGSSSIDIVFYTLADKYDMRLSKEAALRAYNRDIAIGWVPLHLLLADIKATYTLSPSCSEPLRQIIVGQLIKNSNVLKDLSQGELNGLIQGNDGFAVDYISAQLKSTSTFECSGCLSSTICVISDKIMNREVYLCCATCHNNLERCEEVGSSESGDEF